MFGGQSLDRGVAKECVGRLTELHRDLGRACRQVLAGAQIEWHAGPAPIVDAELERDIGFGCGIRRDVGLVPVVPNFSAEHHPAAVLAAHRILRRDGMDRLEQLRLLGAHGVGVERDRRLHPDHGEELEQMVRHHVPQRAGSFVEAAAALDADGLGGCDLNVVDVVAVPQRLEDAVGEAQHQDVLDRFLAEEVIDPIDLVFGQHLEDLRVEGLAPRQGRARKASRRSPAAMLRPIVGSAPRGRAARSPDRRTGRRPPDRTRRSPYCSAPVARPTASPAG